MTGWKWKRLCRGQELERVVFPLSGVSPLGLSSRRLGEENLALGTLSPAPKSSLAGRNWSFAGFLGLT